MDRFNNTFKVCEKVLDKFVLLRVYPCRYKHRYNFIKNFSANTSEFLQQSVSGKY